MNTPDCMRISDCGCRLYLNMRNTFLIYFFSVLIKKFVAPFLLLSLDSYSFVLSKYTAFVTWSILTVHRIVLSSKLCRVFSSPTHFHMSLIYLLHAWLLSQRETILIHIFFKCPQSLTMMSVCV